MDVLGVCPCGAYTLSDDSFLSVPQRRVIIVLLVELVNDEHPFDKKNIILFSFVDYICSLKFIKKVKKI